MLTEKRYERALQAACAAGMPFKDIKMADTQVSERARNNAAKSYYFHDDEELLFSRRSLCDITGLKNGKKGFVLTSSYLYSSEFDNKRKNRVIRLPLYNMAGIEVLNESAGQYAVNYKDGGRIEFYLSKYKEGVFALLNQVMEDDAAVTDPEELCKKGMELCGKGEYGQAFSLFLDAAQVGDACSQWWIGNLCENGEGFNNNKDHREANKWYELAARQGYRFAQKCLADNLLTGKGTQKNPKSAQYWYARAAEEYKKEAEAGDRSAMYWMGIFYRNGWGVKRSEEQALYWFKMAADRGHEQSQYLTAERLLMVSAQHVDMQLAKTYAQRARNIPCRDGDRLLSEAAEKLLKLIREEAYAIKKYEMETNEKKKPIMMGTYPTQEDGAKAPIEWLPLATRECKGMTLLVSRYGLDCRPYDQHGVASWKDSDLRKWLNEGFLKEAFTKEEREKIQRVKLENGYSRVYPLTSEEKCKNVNESTIDSVFCLSVDEAVRYFGPGTKAHVYTETAYGGTGYDYVDLEVGVLSVAEAEPTPYAGAMSGTAMREWWLRTPGSSSYIGYACVCGRKIGLCGKNVKSESIYVRPAMWVKLQEERK